MILNINGEKVEEQGHYLFTLDGNKLMLVNYFTGSLGVFMDGSDYRIVPNRQLNEIKKKLTIAKRKIT